MLYHRLPFHCLQREFPQLATVFHGVRKQVASCNVAKRALGKASWDESGIVRSRQLLESEGLGGRQEGQDNLESMGRLEAPRSVIVVAGFLHTFLTTF